MSQAMSVGLVVTTIQAPNPIMRKLAEQTRAAGAPFFVIGDRKSPPKFELAGTSFFSIDDQNAQFGAFSRLLPVNHYVRKNIGYLAAWGQGLEWIVETDDDNEPMESFLHSPPERLNVRQVDGFTGWVNAYDYFAPSEPVWPRGLPLPDVLRVSPVADSGDHLIRPLLLQGLADENPDVDAIYRLTRSLPVHFEQQSPLYLSSGQWCPFNSQNTWWNKEIAALMYLPAYCSFRMTDIWRSFVAQRCLWAQNTGVVFTSPTVRQERNEHDLLRDFSDEVPGYINNENIRQHLDNVNLTGDSKQDLHRCYSHLIQHGIFDEKEIELVEAWLLAIENLAVGS